MVVEIRQQAPVVPPIKLSLAIRQLCFRYLYSITNNETSDCYIGQAVNIAKRWTQHRSQLNAGTHHNQYLQAHWDEFGERAFIFKIERECERHELDKIEEKFIDEYGTYNAEMRAYFTLSVGPDNYTMGAVGEEPITAPLENPFDPDRIARNLALMEEIMEAHLGIFENPALLDSLDSSKYPPELINGMKEGLEKELKRERKKARKKAMKKAEKHNERAA